MGKNYESEDVPLSREARRTNIGLGCVVTVFALAFLAQAIFARVSNKSDRAIYVFYALLAVALGVYLLVRSIRRTHERVLTAAGKAARAADERAAAQRRAKHYAEFLWWVFIICGVALVVYCIEPIADVIQNRITVYPIYCSTTLTATGACANNGKRAHDVIKYIVHVDQQLVIGLTEKAPAPIKRYNCVVADRKNWSCTLWPEKDSLGLVMHDGSFSYDPPETGFGRDRFVSRWEYLTTKHTN